MTKNTEISASNWDGSWEASRQFQFETFLKASPALRIAWLEEALLFAYSSGALKPINPSSIDRLGNSKV